MDARTKSGHDGGGHPPPPVPSPAFLVKAGIHLLVIPAKAGIQIHSQRLFRGAQTSIGNAVRSGPRLEFILGPADGRTRGPG